jgi:phytoene/squalene synthetase
MSLDLYNDTSWRIGRLITTRYSTSFSLGIKSLHRSLRQPVYSVYGFVRVADEIVDTFHDHDRSALLKQFVEDTWQAIEQGISTNPVLHGFQIMVNRYNIDRDLVEAFLRSMEMDLTMSGYDPGQYNEYIYGSAEVVGLMCLKIFCDGDDTRYSELVLYARRLGAAFQKINFLRDIKSDYHDRGRTYFPGVDFSNFTETQKQIIEEDIAGDFSLALKGIRLLDRRSRFGVYLAYRYYVALFSAIKKVSPGEVLEKRFRVSDIRKALLLIGAWLRYITGTI